MIKQKDVGGRVPACFKALFWHLPVGTEKKQENLSQISPRSYIFTPHMSMHGVACSLASGTSLHIIMKTLNSTGNEQHPSSAFVSSYRS
jgi:hypothetical protein